MWDTMAGQGPHAREAIFEIDTLQHDTLMLLLAMTSGGYIVWHTVTSTLHVGNAVPYWVLFPVVTGGLFASYRLSFRGTYLASVALLASSIVSITAAIWVLQTSSALFLYPVVALMGVVLVRPLAGLTVTAASTSLLFVLRVTGPFAFLPADRLIETSIGCLLAVLAPWALWRNMVTAIHWSIESYENAQRNTEEARAHRAQLVQALKQLDTAYYRLERANASLEMAWRAADTAERAKSEFVTSISHELRTPLNLIIGFSEMIVSSPASYGSKLPPAYRSDMMAIYRSAQHLLKLTDDVIDLARIGVGRLALSRENTDLGSIVSESCAIVGDYITAKGLWLRVEMDPSVPEISLDSLRVRQVLLNLLTNAARFTDVGGITISTALEDGSVVVRVTDTGCGIAPEELPRVFEEFRHADRNATAAWAGLGGVGLGLPISRKLVELHGGRMGVMSALGEGTTFWFSIPLGSSGGMVDRNGRKRMAPAALGREDERVLVLAAEDGRLARFLQRHMRGYRVVEARDVADAVGRAVELRALGILADADDIRTVGHLRAPTPIFCLPLPHAERVASRMGVRAYLAKPVSRGELQSAIRIIDRSIHRVLIVDDDVSFVELMVRMLQDIGGSEHDLHVAYNGLEALEQMRASTPDLVLLDLAIPEMSGLEIVAAMAESPGLADVPVVVVSALDQGEWERPLEGTVSIQKPGGFRLEELLGLVESAIAVLEPPTGYLESTPIT